MNYLNSVHAGAAALSGFLMLANLATLFRHQGLITIGCACWAIHLTMVVLDYCHSGGVPGLGEEELWHVECPVHGTYLVRPREGWTWAHCPGCSRERKGPRCVSQSAPEAIRMPAPPTPS